MKSGPFNSLSLIITTYNRSELLRRALEGVAEQTLSPGYFEVVVVDDGSADDTGTVVSAFNARIPLRYIYQNNQGLATARNTGIAAAKGDILLFMDDDNRPDPHFLKEHLKTHQSFPEPFFAVLNYTTWAPGMAVTPLMEFITSEKGLLFCYPALRHKDILDYLFFWGGSSSCKKRFLLDHGLFNPLFRFGNEDAELGYRLSKQGLKVIYNRQAVSYMTRPVSFDDFCRRALLQGRANFICSQLHPEKEVQAWCLMENINQSWKKVQENYQYSIESARELDDYANRLSLLGIPLPPSFQAHLHAAYGEAFWACKIKGIMEERSSRSHSPEGFPQSTFLLDDIKEPFKVVALICVYNEGDIIYHVIRHLLENGIYVYLLNHHSTDNTAEEASKWLGKGLLHIELFPDESNISRDYERIFALRMITRRVEQLHEEIGADWYLHYDADEFRESPWPQLTLRDAIKLVDVLGYNAIDFELLNFRPTDDSFLPGDDVRNYLHYYDPGEELNKPQIKAWKNFGQPIDLSSFLGHQPLFEGRKVFPNRFITLHFPVRSSTHGRKKILQERKNRFDQGEKAEGCHIQYDMVSENYGFIRDRRELTRYNPQAVRKKIWLDSAFAQGRYSNAPPG